MSASAYPLGTPSYEIRFPTLDLNEEQDAEFCYVREGHTWQNLRLHDYAEIYRHAGLYESLFRGLLQCRSPEHVVGLLQDTFAHRGVSVSGLRVLDFGAGNGMVAEELSRAGVASIIGVDILPEARTAAVRDRPGVFSDYVVADFTRVSEEERRRIRDANPNLLVCVAALGFGDVPTAAFAEAFNLIDPNGWVAFNIRDAFLHARDRTGFARLIHAMAAMDVIRVEAWKRYVHRLSVHGKPIEYIAIVARRRGEITEEMVRCAERRVGGLRRADRTPRSVIELVDVSKSYDCRTRALQHVSLSVGEGELVAIVGGSGSGKSTALKLINRLIEPTEGEVRIDGRDVREFDPVRLRRRIGYVFQQIGLFPHLTVSENIAITPRLMKWNRAEIASRVDELLSLVGLTPEEYRDRRPATLSGGQQQRVGFARALAANPSILLLDEPFGAIDPITREALQQDFAIIHRRLRLTCVLVTHDIWEALLLADRIAVMNAGRIVQIGAAHELLESPADEYVASLLAAPRRAARRLEELSPGPVGDDLLPTAREEAA